MGIHSVFLAPDTNSGAAVAQGRGGVNVFSAERNAVPGGSGGSVIPGDAIILDGRDEISWVFQTGGSSPRIPLRVSESVDRQLLAKGVLDARSTPWLLGFVESGQPPIVVRNLWFMERRRTIGPNKVLYFLADRRVALEGRLIDTVYNLMRPGQDRQRPQGPLVNSNIAIFSGVPKSHFVPMSCRTGSQSQGARFSSGLNDNYQPWTALSALLWLLDDNGFLKAYGSFQDLDGTPFRFGKVKVTDRVVERKLLLKAFNPRTSWSGAVNACARQARVMVYVDEDGGFVVDDLEPDNSFLQDYGAYQGAGGIPIFASLQRNAPRVTTIYFPTFDEIRWNYDERIAEDVATGEVSSAIVQPDLLNREQDTFFLENVVRMPQDTENYQKGQYVEISKALEEWDRDPDNRPVQDFIAIPNGASGGGATRERIRVYTLPALRAFTSTVALSANLIRDPARTDFRNSVLEARVAAIYSGYRRLFRFPEAWLDHIDNFKAELGTVFAFASRTFQPSPVWMDYWSEDAVLYRGDGPAQSDDDLGLGHIRNNPIGGALEEAYLKSRNAQDLRVVDRVPESEIALAQNVEIDTDVTEPAPARIQVIDKPQGVISFEFPPDLTGMTSGYNPGLINAGVVPGHQTLLKNDLKDTLFQADWAQFFAFRFFTILSVEWRSPNSPKRFFSITTPGDRFITGAGGPSKDVYFPSFPAVRSWRDGAVSFNFNTGRGLEITHKGDVANEPALKEIAEGEFQQLYFRYRPRVIGTFRAKGWTGQKPRGHVGNTAVRFKDGVFETVVVAENAPKAPSVWEFFSPRTRNLLGRFEKGTP